VAAPKDPLIAPREDLQKSLVIPSVVVHVSISGGPQPHLTRCSVSA
jgi:hypothetical protein